MLVTQERLIEELRRLLGKEKVLEGIATSRAYDCDSYTVDKSLPSCVVLPTSTEEVSQVITWCAANDVPFTARGAGTGLSGGSMPALGGVVISTKKMTQILEVDVPNRCMLAQAGIANKKLSDAVKDFGLHFAPDPSSQSVSTLGGNIAENAGGPHTLKYGVTAQHILGLTLVDPSGEIVRFGGKVASMPGIDFIGVLVGSEGTMGVVTEAWVKLVPVPTSVATMLISFGSVRAATQTVADIIAEGTIPAALEMMDKGIMTAVSAAFGLTYPPESQALLLIECDSSEPLPESAEKVQTEAATVSRICHANGALEVRVAQDETERAQLWTARKKGVGAMGRLAPTVVTHDGVIPRSKLPEMLDYVYKVSAELEIGVANIFHAGDGNLHPIFYFDERDPEQIRRVVEAGELLMKRCIDLGGSITGEHGVGIEKADLMRLMFSETDMSLQMDVRSIFNQSSICNPCKIIPDQKSCVEHKSRWRGMAW